MRKSKHISRAVRFLSAIFTQTTTPLSKPLPSKCNLKFSERHVTSVKAALPEKKAPLQEKLDWESVHKKIAEIAHDPEELKLYVLHVISATNNVATLLNLGRSELCRPIAEVAISNLDLSEGGEIWIRMKNSQRYCAALIALSVLLKEDNAKTRITSIFEILHHVPNSNFQTIIDSLGARPSFMPDNLIYRGLSRSGFLTNSAHRLVIASSLDNLGSLSFLFAGADKVTVIAPTSLVEQAGKEDITLHCPYSDVRIEHPRSRITRFSLEYHQLHYSSLEVAQRLVDRFDNEMGGILNAAKPHAEVLLADEIFFPSLRLASINRLLSSPEFDHVVVAVEDSTISRDLCQLLSGISELCQDERVEIVSTDLTEDARLKFRQQLKIIMMGAPPPIAYPSYSLTLPEALKVIRDSASQVAQHLPTWGDEDDRPRVLYGAEKEALYDSASEAYVNMLRKKYDVVFALITHGEGLIEDVNGTFSIPRNWRQYDIDVSNRLQALLICEEGRKDVERHVRQALRIRRNYIGGPGFQGFLRLWFIMISWFERLAQKDELPRVVLVSPIRNPRAMLFAAIAREFGIPSISLEPHVQRTTYCRYGRCLTDYYGVMSHFFQEVAEEDGRIDADRCRVVGSPRIQGEEEYDFDDTQKRARAQLTEEFGLRFPGRRMTISFFSQPSKWDQISSVWQMVLEATEGLEVQVLLKGHPEESSARMTRYLETAEQLGAADRVTLVQGSVKDIIDASDLVLSGYSTTILEAVINRRPAASVVNGDLDYPLEIHDVAGVPIYRNSSSLRNAIVDLPNSKYLWQNSIAEYLSKERQFIDGPEQNLHSLVDEVIDLPAEMAVRPKENYPESYFIDGPHRVYQI